MCGIAGLVGPGAHRDRVVTMIQAIAHRGPDGVGVEVFPDAVLGHARLAIIDLELGRQPMISVGRRWAIAFNGEIYNYRELRQSIGDRYAFSTNSDTETILAAVTLWGPKETFRRIDGMYAISLIDLESGELHLARDHFGIKPLYYARTLAGDFAFGSEAKALRAAGVAFTPDRVSLASFGLARFIPAPFTAFEGIRKLRPGEHLVVRRDRTSHSERIVPHAMAPADTMRRDSAQAVGDMLAAGVRSQLVSDVPVGVLLSGGVDSAVVAHEAHRADSTLHTYCVGYSDSDPETEFAQAAESARFIGTVHKNVRIQAHDFSAAMRKAIWHLEEPMATTSLVSYLLLCEQVVKERKVVLTGQGADEPWAGYDRHQFEALLTQPWGHAGALIAAGIRRNEGGDTRLNRTLRALDDENARWIAYRCLWSTERLKQALGETTVEKAVARIEDALAWADGQIPGQRRDSFERLLQRDAYTDLSDNLLLLGDKLSMAHGLEVRVPFLDVRYATAVLQMPRQAKRTGLLYKQGKVLHKAACARVLDPAIVHRPKMGFHTPLARWLDGELGLKTRERLRATSRLADVLDLAPLLPSIATGQSNSYESQQQTFALWLLDEWFEAFAD